MAGTRDVLIAGGGIIGLSLAVELAAEGVSVTVIERDRSMRGASWAAAGMLAAEDPHHPAALVPLARLSRDLYPEYLARIERLSQMHVPLRTSVALQESDESRDAATVERFAPGLRSRNFELLEEASLDPRDLCSALPVAARKAGVEIIEAVAVVGRRSHAGSVRVETAAGEFEARLFVDCRGAFSEGEIEPRKGQMLTVAFEAQQLSCVVRTQRVYLVPRGDGRIVIGATVERGVRDTVVHEDALAELMAQADALLPGIAAARRVDSWAGIRPGTPDDLPLIGATADANCFVASGHFRNVILLAPATARVMERLLSGEAPDVSLDAFSPLRFASVRR
jgi:glycine oxidase